MTSNTENTYDDLLDKLDTVEIHLAEISVAIANADAACEDLLEELSLARHAAPTHAATMLAAHISSMACRCKQAEDTCTELQVSISDPIF